MKTNPQKTNRRFWLSAAIGLALLFVAATPRTAMAQWNPSPSPSPNNNIYYNAGNVGIGTTSPTSILTVQTTGPDSAGDKYLRVKNTNSFTGLLLDPGQAGDAGWLLMGGYPNAGDFTIRQLSFANYLTIKKNTGNVGIGTTSPGAKLVLSTNTATLPTPPTNTILQVGSVEGLATRFTVDGFASPAQLIFRRADTTAASPYFRNPGKLH